MRGQILFGVLFAGRCRARVSTFADDITVFASHSSDIEAVKKAVKRYKQVSGAKVNFNKIKGLPEVSDILLPGPFCWSDGPVYILEVWFGLDLQLQWKWLKVQCDEEIWRPHTFSGLWGKEVRLAGPVDYSSKQNSGKRGCLSSTLSIITRWHGHGRTPPSICQVCVSGERQTSDHDWYWGRNHQKPTCGNFSNYGN